MKLRPLSIAAWSPEGTLSEFTEKIYTDLTSLFPEKNVNMFQEKGTGNIISLSGLKDKEYHPARVLFLVDYNFKPYLMPKAARQRVPLPTYVLASADKLESYILQNEPSQFVSDALIDEYISTVLPSATGFLDTDKKNNVGELALDVLNHETFTHAPGFVYKNGILQKED